MKRRNVKVVNNQETTVQMAKVVIKGKECKAIVIDHNKRLCFKEVNTTGKTAIGLSTGVFSKQPFTYEFVKRPLATKFTKNDSRKLNAAIKMAELTGAEIADTVTEDEINVETVANDEVTAPETVAEDEVKSTTEVITEKAAVINVRDDIVKEKACYDHCLVRAKKILDNIEALKNEGVPVEYINTRYPDIKEMITTCASKINEQWLNLSFAENKVAELREQLKMCEYNLYLSQEAYIAVMRDQISYLESLDVNDLISEDMAEVKRLNRIRELEEELAELKGESSKFDNSSSQPEEHEPKKEKVPVLDVELATEVQDREIRYLANHLYQVRRGNEEHNPVIYRKIAELSDQMKLSKPEFCKKILSINYNTYDRHHKAFMNSLGLHIYGEKTTLRPVDVDPEEVKTRVLQWANVHLIPYTDNQVLNKDVYNAFTKETEMEITDTRFYLILKRGGGYITKPIQNYEIIDGIKKLVSKTFYDGYRLV